MIGWLKARQKKRDYDKAMAIGMGAVERFNAGLAQWRSERITMHREMLSNDFDERIITLSAQDGLTFHEVVEIDALAAMKNWDERFETVIGQTRDYISDDDFEILIEITGEQAVTDVFSNAWREETMILNEHIDEAIEQAIKRATG